MRVFVVLMMALAPILGMRARGEEAKDAGFDWEIWRRIVALDGGRTKPFDTLAWEQIYAFAGKSKLQPTAFGTVGVADIADWQGVARGLEKELADRVPKTLLPRLKDVNFNTEEMEKEVMRLDGELDAALEAYVTKTGVAVSMKEFRASTTEEKDRELIKRYDETMAKIDAVGEVKSAMLHALNDVIPPGEEAKLGKGKGLELGMARRAYLEKVLGSALRPLGEEAKPTGRERLADRKYDPVELALTLALTWRGWDKVEEIQKLFASREAEQMGFDRVYREFHQPDAWDALPVIIAKYDKLAPKLLGETIQAVSVRTVQENPWFVRWALRAARMKEDKSKKGDLTTADEKAVDVLEAYRAFLLLRSGQTIFVGPDALAKPRIQAIEKEAEGLRAKIDTLGPKEAASEVRSWREKFAAAGDAVGAKDLVEIADRLVKELDVQAGAKATLPAHTLLEQQVRLRVEDISNQIRWMSLLEIIALPKRLEEQGYGSDVAERMRQSLLKVRAALLAGDAPAFNQASKDFAGTLEEAGKNSHLYPPAGSIAMELHYNRFQPFLWTAVLSGIALAILVVSLGMTNSIPYGVGFLTLLGAVGFMVYGMYLRIGISGRPPVTNMYETIIWASFIMAVLGIVLGLVYRHRIVVMTAALALTPATVLAYVMPPEYGAAIDPLVPVLRDNFWLIIHVLTIVASYGALMLAWMMGNVGLAYYLTGNDKSPSIKPIATYVYRSIQVGVLLLAAGTILGGWWAAYSWGRFWGWDPKEVWALIALLGYLAILHARFAGLVKIFGLIASSVVAFAGVVMSWYGVNFVLGEGLHAYAFGSGGQPYVFSVVALNLAYVVLVIVVHRTRMRSRRSTPAVAEKMVPVA